VIKKAADDWHSIGATTVLIAFVPATFIVKADPSLCAQTAEDSMWPLQAAMISLMTMKMMMPKVRQHLPPA